MNPLGSLPSGRTDSWVSKGFRAGPRGITVKGGETVPKPKAEALPSAMILT